MPNTRALHRRENPRHVAVIMDGNGRWATARGLPRLAGHKAGIERVRDTIKACPDLGVTHLTLFAFSTENWKRSKLEVDGLMLLFQRYIRKESTKLQEAGVRVRFIGNRQRLSADLQVLMAQLEEITSQNTGLNATVALDYGGRDEIIRATKRMIKASASGALDPDTITEETVDQYLDTAGLPDPDLVLRTSGEVRVSNFLLWQGAYSEYEFLDICWPDFTADVFKSCIDNYSTRERRYGAVAG